MLLCLVNKVNHHWKCVIPELSWPRNSKENPKPLVMTTYCGNVFQSHISICLHFTLLIHIHIFCHSSNTQNIIHDHCHEVMLNIDIFKSSHMASHCKYKSIYMKLLMKEAHSMFHHHDQEILHVHINVIDPWCP